ncbi:MAG: hypothetical protein LBF66_01995 [Holosporales bacterium]|jgi:hypothetical protein|nr:hypothetical protein [Holosporales bacterium]
MEFGNHRNIMLIAISILLLRSGVATEDRSFFAPTWSEQHKTLMRSVFGPRMCSQEADVILEPMLYKHWELRRRIEDTRSWTLGRGGELAPKLKAALEPEQPLTVTAESLAAQMSSLKNLIVSDQQKDKIISALENTLAEYAEEGLLFKIVQITKLSQTCLQQASDISRIETGSAEDIKIKGVGEFVFQKIHDTAVELNESVRGALGSLLDLIRNSPEPILSTDIYSVLTRMSKQVDSLHRYFGEKPQ